MKNLIILIIIGLFFSLNACKPVDPIEDIIQYPINSELKSYFGAFKEGSWWVYQDTVSGRIDTFKVTKYIEESKSKCYMAIDDKEVFSSLIYYKIEHSLIGNGVNIWAYRVRTDCDSQQSFVDISFGYGRSLKYYFEDGKFLEHSFSTNNDSLIATYYSIYKLNNTIYNDVYYIENTSKEDGLIDNDFIFCKNIGLIGFNVKIYNTNMWKNYWVLIDKNIVL